MKRKYNTPEVEITAFDTEDIITLSNTDDFGDDGLGDYTNP